MKKELWEVLVPKCNNSGEEFSVEYHRAWDKIVREMSGGLTVMRSAKGTWLNDGDLYEERVIPCRLIATRSGIMDVLNFTKNYYSQIAVMAYKISEDVIIYY